MRVCTRFKKPKYRGETQIRSLTDLGNFYTSSIMIDSGIRDTVVASDAVIQPSLWATLRKLLPGWLCVLLPKALNLLAKRAIWVFQQFERSSEEPVQQATTKERLLEPDTTDAVERLLHKKCCLNQISSKSPVINVQTAGRPLSANRLFHWKAWSSRQKDARTLCQCKATLVDGSLNVAQRLGLNDSITGCCSVPSAIRHGTAPRKSS